MMLDKLETDLPKKSRYLTSAFLSINLKAIIASDNKRIEKILKENFH